MRKVAALLACSMFWGAMACEKGHATQEAAESTKSSPPRKSLPRPTQEQIHRKAAESVLLSAVARDYSGLVRAADGLSVEEWSPPIKGDWKPHQSALKKAAKRLAKLEGAAGTISEFSALSGACVGCHRSVHYTPQTPTPVDPWSTMEVAPAMREHYRATLLLWEGLTGPSEQLWTQGTEALGTADWIRSDVIEVDRLIQRVKTLAASAATTAEPQRGVLVGELLSTCGTCHDTLEVGPQVRAYLQLSQQ